MDRSKVLVETDSDDREKFVANYYEKFVTRILEKISHIWC